ncbi:MAG: hypothetical protein E3K37_09640 [Candidatus Kuenenia sp.]|nr:hypothetical protein [Candidatus Kuenenia hertensis]
MQYSIVSKSNIEGAFRINSEYYQPKFLASEKLILSKNYELLEKLSIKITDFGAYSQNNIIEYKQNGFAVFIRNQDIHDFFINDTESIYIDKEVYEQLSLHLEQNDILIQRVGSLGKASIVLPKDLPSTANQNLAQVKIKSNKINPFYLICYLNCQFGISSFERLQTGNVQPWLNLQQICSLKIPVFSDVFQNTIEVLVKEAFGKQGESKELFKESQSILLSELGLTNWQPKHQLSFVKNYSDTEQAERVDAEYFQPKYEEIEQSIKEYSGGYSTIGAEFKQNKSTFKIDNKKVYQYVEIGSVNVSNGEILANEVIGEELPANAKRALKKNDVIVSKVRTYRGAITIVEENGYVGSGAFTVLRENGRINKETLFAFLHSKPLLAWSLKPNTGTSYPVIVDNDILNLPIPLLPESKQLEIQQKVNESSSLRKQSKLLLECAKRAVEIAIEQDEKTAIKWLENETKEMQI